MSHYDILGVEPDADAAAIKRAHRQLVQKHHPDKPEGDKEKFQQIQRAYDTLGDEEKRRRYDQTGQDSGPERSEQQMIVPMVVGAFDRAMEKAGSAFKRQDIVASMVKFLGEDRQRGVDANAQLQADKDRMEASRKRMGFKGDGLNILDSMLISRIAEAGQKMAQNTATMELVDKAIEHVRLYGWEVEPAPAPPMYGFNAETYREEFMKRIMDEALMPHSFMADAFRPMPFKKPGVVFVEDRKLAPYVRPKGRRRRSDDARRADSYVKQAKIRRPESFVTWTRRVEQTGDR